jgi:hypothetical protein
MVRKNSFRFVVGLTLVMMATAACNAFGSSASTVAPSPVGTPTQTPRTIAQGSPVPAGPPPSPASVDTGSVVMIERWRQYSVPLYPGATEAKFTQLGQTTVTNGGSALYTSEDSPDKILAYYLGALPTYGWKQSTANSRSATFKSSKASLTISVSSANGGTSILMILGDV